MTATPASIASSSEPAVSAASGVAPARLRGLRIATLAALLMLTVQYGFGVWVGHTAELPAGDHDAGLFSGFARAVYSGPVGLSMHAVLGVLLLSTAVSVLVRAALAHQPAAVGLAALGLAALLVAALAAARFIGQPSDTASLVMALATGVAIGAYVITLFTTRTPTSSAH
jgi:hypothetical protein